MSQIRKFALGAISACVVAMSPMSATAGTIQLGFILDRSGSIGAGNWNIIVDGLSSAINTLIPVGGADTYEISIVTFSGAASKDVSNVLVNSVAARSNLATAIFNLGDGRSNDVYTGGTTNYSAAFLAMDQVLRQNATADFTYVNFATDGEPNPSASNGLAERATMISSAAGGYVDNISIEGIGGGVNAAFLQNSICYPQPCDSTSPYSFPTNGFYIGVANAAGYAAAIGNKIRIVTNQTPEPGTIALAGLALAGLGLARRRKTA